MVVILIRAIFVKNIYLNLELFYLMKLLFIVELLKVFVKKNSENYIIDLSTKNTTWSKHLCQEMEESDFTSGKFQFIFHSFLSSKR